MTQQFSYSVVTAMVAQVVKVGYLIQGEILIVRNFVNAHLWQLLCIYSLWVHRNEFTNMLISVIFWFGVQLKFQQKNMYSFMLFCTDSKYMGAL